MAPKNTAFDLQKCARSNILALEPYRCARDDYKDDGTNILLDANENAYGPGLALSGEAKPPGANVNGTTDSSYAIDVDLLGLNRYPDPHQEELKQLLCNLRNTHTHTPKDITPANLFVGVGSDEAIDALIRAFCVPGREKILTCPPTYGMYSVSAQVNDVSLVKVPLQTPSFDLDVPAILKALDEDKSIKLAYLCSPGNPTGKLLHKEDVQQILEHQWNGVVVLDEAYIDFSPDGTSLAEWVAEWPNLVVMQTLSKAFGLAGIRLGAAFAHAEIAQILNNMKAPYNIPNPTSQLARAALSPKHLEVMRSNRNLIVTQRNRLIQELPKIPGVGNLHGGTESNFLLYQILDAPADQGGKPSNETALAVYEGLAEEKGVVVRFRGKEHGCLGCLRITVGTEKEVDRFLQELKQVLEGIHKKTAVAHINTYPRGLPHPSLPAPGTPLLSESVDMEAEFKVLKANGRLLQRPLALTSGQNMASDHSAFMKKYNATTQRILAERSESRDAGSTTRIGITNRGAVVLMFCNKLLRKHGLGGAEAAILLRNALSERIATRFPGIARNKHSLVTRIFADLKTLSLNGAAHNNLKLYMTYEWFKNIYLIAAESPQYHQVLEPYRKQTLRITLVFGSGLDSGLQKLGLLLISFPKVFLAPPGIKMYGGNVMGPGAAMDKDMIKGEANSGKSEHAKTSEDLMHIYESEKALWSPLFSSRLPAC
ncbi:histidinol-phosphate aminotransferase [Stemphylium lycopersici]|nr:histidinol-phosphate aminotransferase [Stemphylium lycopersici]RAR02520.1 histidinol-phosphate aminotransferase [Stemphylium lycopersici]